MIAKKIGSFLIVLTAALTVAACAEGVGDIDRVQPNYYSKTQFEGTWYYRQTVIDVPYENGWTFNGIGSDLEKIRWEIREDSLVAYRVFELIPGANGPPANGKPEFTPVGAWAIERHFDIVREYNPGTGEQTNVISENINDRPWYERDYIRVDWSVNLIPNQNGIDTFLGFDGQGNARRTKMTGANYSVQAFEEDNPDRLEVLDDYIGVVGLYHVEPDVYTCYLVYNDMMFTGVGDNCGPTTIKIRSSFMKIDPKRERYEPLEYSDQRPLLADIDLNGDGKVDSQDRIDKSLTICTGTEVQDGVLVCSRYAEIACTPDTINRLNADPFYAQFGYAYEYCGSASPAFFDKFGYFRTEHITYDRERGHTETGRLNFANRWNLWKSSYDEEGRAIPYGDREVRTIDYTLNADFPEDLYPAAAEIQRQWNEAFQRTVAALQGKAMEEVGDVFVIHQNRCSPSKLREFVAGNAKARAIADRLIGGVDNVDFSNQERLCAALEYNLGPSTFTWAKNGDLRYSFVYWVDRPQGAGPLGFGPSYADPETGEMISGTAYVYGAGVDTYAAFATDIVELMAGRLELDYLIDGSSIRGAVLDSLKRKGHASHEEIPDAFFGEMSRRLSAFDSMPGGRFPKLPAGHFDSRLQRLRGTSLEREHFADEMTLSIFAKGWRPGDPITEEILDQVSPATLFSPAERKRREERTRYLSANHCMLMAGFVDSSVIGLALEYDADKKAMSRDEIYRDLRAKIFVGVMLHEIGHTLGLRHNFSASGDALNYFPEFWKYQTLPTSPAAARSSATLDEEEIARLDRCVEKAEAWGLPEPTTLECLRGSELKQASIMDYGAKFNSDFMGLGRYDKAAIAFGYGGLVEVFDDEATLPILPLSYFLSMNDYKTIPENFGGPEGIDRRKLVPYAELTAQRAKDLLYNESHLPKFSQAGGSLVCVENCELPLLSREVPYKFCSDEFASFRLGCKLWDEGANQSEVVQSAIDQFRTYYYFHAFKRDRFNWSPASYYNRMMNRTFVHFTDAFTYYYLYDYYYPTQPVTKDLGLAGVLGLNMLAEILQTPEPGNHCRDASSGVYYPAEFFRRCDATTPGAVTVPIGTGRSFWGHFTDGYHYGWSDAPSYYEKVYALQALMQPQGDFYRVTEIDASTSSINYFRLFHSEMLELIGGIIMDDNKEFSGRAVERDGKMVYVPKLLVDPMSWGGSAGGAEVGAPLFSPNSYYLRDAGVLFGMALLTSPLDSTMDFGKYFKIALKGSNDDWDLSAVDESDPEVYVEVTDPGSHYTYRAAATPDGHSFGYRMVKDARDFRDQRWAPARAALDAIGPEDPGYADAKALEEESYRRLVDKISFLDVVRNYGRLFEFGVY